MEGSAKEILPSHSGVGCSRHLLASLECTADVDAIVSAGCCGGGGRPDLSILSCSLLRFLDDFVSMKRIVILMYLTSDPQISASGN